MPQNLQHDGAVLEAQALCEQTVRDDDLCNNFRLRPRAFEPEKTESCHCRCRAAISAIFLRLPDLAPPFEGLLANRRHPFQQVAAEWILK
eukprot:CAMPEP_0181516318 /NCGR_PEP_ID=MMETSP1110-20121109/64050_1 /TAXON_ID=174948 /ORGANISM="Symbiodinium sp., Strain CCMP421" /LENGTH=89 /DNA_ID=CAMNT_0023646407 /DNA_START=215 /DNA_END=481 /DNA_ORIENTATION=-